MASISKGKFMNLDDVLALKKWTPLSDAVKQIAPAAFLGKSLYRLGNGLYLYLTPFRLGNFGSDPAAPFLSGVFCTPDDGAAKRITALDVEADSGILLNPPSALLPSDSAPEYGAILAGLKKMNPKVCQETASYRIASDGRFVHRTIETERFTYYFRHAEHDDHEPPYAILYKF